MKKTVFARAMSFLWSCAEKDTAAPPAPVGPHREPDAEDGDRLRGVRSLAECF